jgi:regulator of replication initiation timing
VPFDIVLSKKPDKEVRRMKKIESGAFDSEFQGFLDSLKKNSRNTYHSCLAYWMSFTGMNGKESIEFKKNDKDAATEKKVVAFKQWLMDAGKGENTARTATGAIRGFYASKRMPLTFIASEKKRIQEANRVTEDFLFAKEDLVKMVEQANFLDRYVVLVGKSIGLRAGDFLSLTYGQFRSMSLDSEAPISIGRIETRKEHVKAYPFLDSDSVETVKAILKKNPEAKDEERVLSWTELSLTHCLQRLFANAHLVSGKKRVRFHCLRKYLIDRLSAVASESQWKQIVGKKIAEAAYVSPDRLRDVYEKAMPSIVINGNGKSHVKIEELETKLTEMEGQNTQLRLELAEVKNRKTIESLLEYFQQEKKKIAEEAPKDEHRGVVHAYPKGFVIKPNVQSQEMTALLRALKRMGDEKE